MEDLDVAFLQDEEINQIWEMLLMNLGENQQQNIDLSMIKIVSRAISKLSKTTPFNFKNFSQQEWIMNGVFNLLNFQTIDIDDKEENDPERIRQKDQIVKDNTHKVEIVKAGIASLIEIARLNYKDMGHWLDKLFEHTK